MGVAGTTVGDGVGVGDGTTVGDGIDVGDGVGVADGATVGDGAGVDSVLVCGVGSAGRNSQPAVHAAATRSSIVTVALRNIGFKAGHPLRSTA